MVENKKSVTSETVQILQLKKNRLYVDFILPVLLFNNFSVSNHLSFSQQYSYFRSG